MSDSGLPATPESKPKRRRLLWLKITLAIPLLLILWVAGSALVWLTNQSNGIDYIPAETIIQAEIPSVSGLYQKTLDSRALDAALDALHIGAAYDASLELRKTLAGSGTLFQTLVDVPLRVMLLKGEVPVILIEAGWRGTLLQYSAILPENLVVAGWRFTKTMVANRAVFAVTPEKSSQSYDNWYLCYTRGVLLASPQLKGIERSLAAFDQPDNRASPGFQKVLGALAGNQEVRVSFQATELLGNLGAAPGLLADLVKEVEPAPYGALGLGLKKEGLSIQAKMAFKGSDSRVQKLMAPGGDFHLLQYATANTTLFTGVRVNSIQDLHAFLRQVAPTTVPAMEDFDAATELLFGLKAADLVFPWAGQEYAVDYVGTRESPVLLIELKDRAKFEALLQKLSSTIFVEQDSGLVLDGNRLQRIKIPDVWRTIAGWFGVELDLPWFTITDSVLALSLSAESLSEWTTGLKKGEKLTSQPLFRSMADSEVQESDILLWYDASVYQPAVLRNLPYVGSLLKYYRYGLAGLAVGGDALTANLRLGGDLEAKVRLLPDYPRDLDSPPDVSQLERDGAVWLGDLVGGSNPELVYIDRNERLVIAGLDGKVMASTMAEREAWPVVFPAKPNSLVYALGQSGQVYALKPDGLVPAGFPKSSAIRRTFAPQNFDSDQGPGYLVFDESNRAISLFKNNGQTETLIPNINNPVLQSPSLSFPWVALYPRSLDGTLLVHTLPYDGTNQALIFKAGALGASGPVIALGDRLVFATQEGTLAIWQLTNPKAEPRTVKFDNQIHFSPQTEGANIFVRTDDGTISRVVDGLVTQTRQWPEIAGTRGVFLGLGGAKPWLFAGNGNQLLALSPELGVAPGFPVAGTRPFLVDLNGDGQPELVTLGYDGKIYAYTLPGL